MTDDKLLHQDEVDALLKAAAAPGISTETASDLTAQQAADTNKDTLASEAADSSGAIEGALNSEERDALGEIGNISMGSAATTLSQLLNKRVLITSPTVNVKSQKEFLKGFNMPFLMIKVKFKEGFDGYNVLIIKMRDAIVMANLMMGGDGIEISEEISEMEISAAAEAMNQMIGTASTSLADLLNRNINIMPPETELVIDTEEMDINLPFSDPIVVISFRMNIEDLLDTSIMQVIDMGTAREQSDLLWKKFSSGEEEEVGVMQDEEIPELPPEIMGNGTVPQFEEVLSVANDAPAPPNGGARTKALPTPSRPVGGTGSSLPPQIDPEKFNLLLDIPLKVSVVLGRTKKQIKDVLQMTPGAIVELETIVGEPVEILVNGKLVARGEVVVVNENFGVKINNIISTRDRIHTLGAENTN